MEFLKQNRFLAGLIGVTVVFVGIGVWMISSSSAQYDKVLDLRKKASASLDRLDRPPFVNERIVNLKRGRVDGIKAGAGDVRQFSVEQNGKGYKVLILPLKDVAGKVERRIPAFPIDRELYEKHRARYVATEEYRKAVLALVASLRPTQAPTADEILAEQANALARLQAEQKRLAPAESTTPGAPPAPGVPGTPHTPGRVHTPGRPRTPGGMPDRPGMHERRPPPDMMIRPDMRGGHGMPSGPGPAAQPGVGERGASTDMTQEANRQGALAARAKKAVEGMIYATEKSMDFSFVAKRNNATDTELWMAQVNLWIQGDIVRTIIETNRQALSIKRIDEKKGNVLNVPIKRLVNISVDKNYVAAAAEAAERGASGGPARSGHGPGIGGPMGVYEPRSTPDAPRDSGRTDRGAGAAGAKNSLTKNVSCKDFDVIRYQFTVVMPARYIPLLTRTLYARAYHKALRIEMRSPTAEELSGYYYGTDAVMRVTLYGEQLLLTDWVRGTWVRKPGQKARWSEDSPPLTPVAVLRSLPTKALRKEDARYIKSVLSTR